MVYGCAQSCFVIIDCLDETQQYHDTFGHCLGVLALQLPPLRSPNVATGFEIWTSLDTSIKDLKAPFILPQDSRLLAFELEITDTSTDNIQNRTFFVPVSTILSRLQLATADNHNFPLNQDPSRDGTAMTILPWAAWGQDARLLPQTSVICGMCGSRALVSELLDGHEERDVIALYDFATLPSLLADAEYLCQNPDIDSNLCSIPLPLPHDPDDVLATKVVSAAPFRRTLTKFSSSEGEELILYEDGVCIFVPETDG